MAEMLLIDVGNTFLKWGLYRREPLPMGGSAVDRCQQHDRVLLDEIASLSRTWRRLPTPGRIVISNVAGTRIRNPLMRAIEAWPDAPVPHWLTSQPQQCGLTNGYLNPGQLGIDRWAAMIGARHLVGNQPVLVAMCGTATTIDLVDTAGRFLGGTIMPGLGLMLRVLHEQTAALPDAAGEYVEHPRQTVDAITSGCIHAQAGAIERQFQLAKSEQPGLECVVSGGGSQALMPRLNLPARHHDNLVLEGVFRMAMQPD